MKTPDVKATQRELKLRELLFKKCESKEHLRLWILNYLGIDLPGGIVYNDNMNHEDSNSSPLDFCWEVYSKALDGTDENFQRILVYSARSCYKCCKKGTLILSKNGLTPIEDIKIGDIIWSGKSWRSVTDWIHDGEKESVTVTLKNGLDLTVSPIHKIWAWSEGELPTWKTVSELSGDELVCVQNKDEYQKNEWIYIDNVKKTGIADFYDLTVDVDHSYWSNGIISHNTLSMAILETLCLLHLERNCVHMAAILQQSQNCQRYINEFFQKKILRDFLISKNGKTVQAQWYKNDAGKIISPIEFKELSKHDQSEYYSKAHEVEIVTATERGANGQHASFVCSDETDICPPLAFEEAKLIPDTGKNGELPIFIMISSRKTSSGLIQKELDRALEDPNSNLQVRHWNILDVTQACPATKHLPDEPKVNIYYNEEDFCFKSEADYQALPEEEKLEFEKGVGFAGCLKNCILFPVCQTKLAVKQQCKSRLCKPIAKVSSDFKGSDMDVIKAQLMCWRPSSSDLVFPHFSRLKHVISADEMYKLMEDSDPPQRMSKVDLINYLIRRKWSWHLGMDFGFTHNFATVLAATNGHYIFILDCSSIPGLEVSEMINICVPRYHWLNPSVYPDNACPAYIKSFKRNRFRCKDFTKDILLGISTIRQKLNPGFNLPPECFFLAGDSGVALLVKELSLYHWKLDSAGEPTAEPDKIDDDLVDACKYIFQNLFGKNGSISLSNKAREKNSKNNDLTKNNWMTDEIQRLTGGSGPLVDENGNPVPIVNGRGNFKVIF